MNPQMMQFGNQPGGYSQPGNFTGNYSPGSGLPPGENFPPPGSNLGSFSPSTQFQQAAAQQKNLTALPTTMNSESYMEPGGPNALPTMPPTGPRAPHNMPPTGPHVPPTMPPTGPQPSSTMPLTGPQTLPTMPPVRPHGMPTMSPSGPQAPPSVMPSGPLPPGYHPHQSAAQGSSPLNGQLGSPMPPSSQNSAPISQLPHPPQSSGPLNRPYNSTPVSQGLSGTQGSHGPSVTQQMSLNGPLGPPMLGNQSQYPSRQSGPPLSGVPNQGGDQQFNSSQINGSSSTMTAQNLPHSQGQMDPSRQYINGAPQGQLPGGPLQHGPPLNYGPGQMPPTQAGLTKPAYPRMSNMSQPNPAAPPYPQSQQIRSPYSPATGAYGKGNYPSGPMPPQPDEMYSGYPPTSQGSYQQTNQPYSGLNQNYSGMPHQGFSQPHHEQKSPPKLNPDILPNPIQVMEDDEKVRSGIFYTDQKGLMPPLVTTNFVTQDQGNCSPRFLRSTTYNVPVTADLLKQTNVPFALLISPLARLAEGEQPPPIVNLGELGPVRCVRCKAYMSPLMQFIDGGRKFHCVFCKATTEVPAEYFQHLDHTGQRVDRFERPELLLGAYEFIATKDYCRNNQPAEPPAMIFVIDVSYNNIKNGLVHLLCSKMKEIIRNLPRDEGLEVSNMKVGFITYSTSVHFYNIKSCLAAPQMMLVGDVNEMFMPLLDGFLCDPIESEAVIDLLMQEIPKQFADTRDTEIILYPAIQAGLEALKASGCAGKLLVFHSSLPIGEAPGKLKNRDDRKLLNTEKEKAVLAPQNNAYNNLAQECVQAGCSVDLFIFNNSYVDIATIGEISRLTGGEIFKYTYFQADIDGERFIADLKRDVSRQIAFDAIMRVRTSTGVRPTDFYGHFFMSNTKDMELASIDSDKAVAVEIKHDDKLSEEEGVYIQVALLYTSCGGQRRLRILNLSLKTCSQMADLYRCSDLDTLVNYLSKQGIFKLLEGSPKQVKNNIMNRCANILACYRKNCANSSSTGQLILPECMKLLPLYVNSLLKSDAFSGGSDMTCDDRSFAMHCVMVMDLNVSVVYFYPRLLALHNINPNNFDSPPLIRCTYEKLQDTGVYLLDNGIHMFMWLGLNASTSFISNVFGVPTTPQVDTDRSDLPPLDNPLSLRVRQLISDIREKRHRSMRLTVLKQRDKMEMVFKQYLMEDHGVDGSPSYSDFLCHMHTQIRTILS